jgi:glutathione S-transferase
MGLVNDAASFGATVVRLGRGLYPAVTAGDRPAPKRLLELYEFENCPYCRKVREVLCELDLDYLCRSVAHGSPRRADLRKAGGKLQVPYLIDPNTGTALYESRDINAYLNEHYGAGKRAGWTIPLPEILDDAVSAMASGMRLGRGTRTSQAERSIELEPLVLYNMEGSPYCRKVREALSELDLEFVVRNMPKGSPKRRELIERAGRFQVPYLVDPNTGEEMFESDEIVAYLRANYASSAAPSSKARAARAAGPRRVKRRG